MLDVFELQSKLAQAYGPSGNERETAALIESAAKPFADEISRDVLGNLTVRKKGSGKKVMFSAHMDSIGMVVTHIDKNGFLRFAGLGGLKLTNILGSAVRFENGQRGVVFTDGKADSKSPDINSFYIDIGADSRESAQESVKAGDSAVFDQKTFEQGNKLLSPYLDDRIGCAVLLCALEKIQENKNDLYFVFSAQEELGCRGAQTAAYAIEPEYGFAVDTTATGDTPECKPEMACALGGGAAIKLLDKSVISHPEVVRYLKEQAGKRNIKVQDEILTKGGTDTGVIQRSGIGAYAGAISIPVRYLHNPLEMCDRRDVDACVELVLAASEIGF